MVPAPTAVSTRVGARSDNGFLERRQPPTEASSEGALLRQRFPREGDGGQIPTTFHRGSGWFR